MKAGRELDALIAEKVMGWTRNQWKGMLEKTDFCVLCGITCRAGNHPRIEHDFCRTGKSIVAPEYSTSIADAWLVVEKMQSNAWAANVLTHEADDNMCEFWKLNDLNFPVCVNHQASVPLAICLAALKAVEEKEQ